jgi:uridine monophosphate synthetase
MQSSEPHVNACMCHSVGWLQKEGLEVSDVVVLIDRQQGGREHLKRNNMELHAAFTLTFIVETLQTKGLLSSEVVEAVKTFIAENQTSAPVAGAFACNQGPEYGVSQGLHAHQTHVRWMAT